jgi:hypothetical protein
VLSQSPATSASALNGETAGMLQIDAGTSLDDPFSANACTEFWETPDFVVKEFERQQAEKMKRKEFESKMSPLSDRELFLRYMKM